MKTFTIMPEGCRWYNVTAATAEMHIEAFVAFSIRLGKLQ